MKKKNFMNFNFKFLTFPSVLESNFVFFFRLLSDRLDGKSQNK